MFPFLLLLPVYFTFDYPPAPETFVIELTDPAKIETARNNLGNPNLHLMGKVIPAKAWYNYNWSYHLDPNSVDFFENAIEVCDASMQYLEDNLESICGSFLPQCSWCPWGSRLLFESNPADRDDDHDVDFLDLSLWLHQTNSPSIFTFNHLLSFY